MGVYASHQTDNALLHRSGSIHDRYMIVLSLLLSSHRSRTAISFPTVLVSFLSAKRLQRCVLGIVLVTAMLRRRAISTACCRLSVCRQRAADSSRNCLRNNHMETRRQNAWHRPDEPPFASSGASVPICWARFVQ